MASAFTLSQGDYHDPDFDPSTPSNFKRPSPDNDPRLSTTLSRISSESLSPSVVQFDTPVGSHSTPGHYQPSDCSDLDEDIFFGANFDNLHGSTPAFLNGDSGWEQSTVPEIVDASTDVHSASYPLTPDQTASIHTLSPANNSRDSLKGLNHASLPTSVSPQELHTPFKPPVTVTEISQLTPTGTSSGRSSEDGLAPATVVMANRSPQVTVSVWDRDESVPIHTVTRTFDDSPNHSNGGRMSAGDLISTTQADGDFPQRDSLDGWERNFKSGRCELDPFSRHSVDILSINDIATQRAVEDREQNVGEWLHSNLDDVSAPLEKTPEEIQAIDSPGKEDLDGIPLGDKTENKYESDQIYYHDSGRSGPMTEEDHGLIYGSRNWGNAPLSHPILTTAPGHFQPQTSQAAIAKFNMLCRDNDSIISRSATWGTRRRSMPSLYDYEIEQVTSGNLLKKLSISRGADKGTNKSVGILEGLRGLVRRPSAATLRKRSRSGQGEALADRYEERPQEPRRESSPRLSPMSRTTSWGKKQTPSINTAIASMAHPLASIGATHARSGSRSSGTSMTSPKGGLSVLKSLRRPRSKSELPKTSDISASNNEGLVGIWRKTGGPPVPALSKAALELDDDDDDDDDMEGDNDLRHNPNIIDEFTANFSGFSSYILRLNPDLATQNNYLVDRIAHQQNVRYKFLLNNKVKHLGLGANCPCGSLCLALGGSANVLDQRGDAKGLDPLSTSLDGDDQDDGAPTEGVINQESFPLHIPMPPTQYLPAEFECQLCFQRKKFQKPSDWTKHVHEDVQPFTCTWDKCREPKIFKRKADWVRHENEGHRHLEWWTCDVEDCRHTCYRRDNFLQHLVREHKFVEPKVKTKAAMKKAGAAEPTWQKVEQCHMETSKRPQEEPCRFCGAVFPTWKKLTVHLAKHMEQISLPVLRHVAAKAKELAADTIISPVQDPPPRTLLPSLNGQRPQSNIYNNSYVEHQPHHSHMPIAGFTASGSFTYPISQSDQVPSQFYTSSQYPSMDHALQQSHLENGMTGPMDDTFPTTRGMESMPASSGAYMQAGSNFIAMNHTMTEPFPSFDAGLGLSNVHTSHLGEQLAYNTNLLDPSSVNGSPFSGHETIPTYSRSPNPNGNNGGRGWEEHRQPEFY